MVYVFESILIISRAQTYCEPPPWAAVFRPWQPLVMRLLQNSCSLQSWKILPLTEPQVVSVPQYLPLFHHTRLCRSKSLQWSPGIYHHTLIHTWVQMSLPLMVLESLVCCVKVPAVMVLPLPNQSLSLHCQHSAYPGLPVVRTGFVE